MLQLHGFTEGPLIPALGYLVSSVGVFLGLRCASRARACPGPARTRWLVLAGVAIGGLGIWAMDFIALLGFAVAGETTRYSGPVTLASLLLAVATAAAGLLIAGAGNLAQGGLALGALPLGGLVAGLGVAAVHYLGMAAMRMPGRLSYAPLPFALSVVVAVAAATAVLWGAARLRGAASALGFALVLGLLLCGMHYTAMAATRVSAAAGPAGLVAGGGGGATAAGFLLPVILGTGVVVFVIWAAVALSPTEDAINYDAALLAHIRRRTENPAGPRAATPVPAPLATPVPAPLATPPPAASLPPRDAAASAPAEPGARGPDRVSGIAPRPGARVPYSSDM